MCLRTDIATRLVLVPVSAVDDIDFLRSQGQVGAISFDPLDMFRFQNNVAGRDPSTDPTITTIQAIRPRAEPAR